MTLVGNFGCNRSETWQENIFYCPSHADCSYDDENNEDTDSEEAEGTNESDISVDGNDVICQCDICKKDVCTTRWHCAVCADFDLCIECKYGLSFLKCATKHKTNITEY